MYHVFTSPQQRQMKVLSCLCWLIFMSMWHRLQPFGEIGHLLRKCPQPDWPVHKPMEHFLNDWCRSPAWAGGSGNVQESRWSKCWGAGQQSVLFYDLHKFLPPCSWIEEFPPFLPRVINYIYVVRGNKPFSPLIWVMVFLSITATEILIKVEIVTMSGVLS